MINKALVSASAFSLLFTLVLSLAPLALADGENTFSDPENFTEWQVLGPSGGDVRAVTIDPRDKDRLYISTIDGQIHTSGDGGRTWSLLVNLNEPGLVLDQLMVDLRDSKTIYTSGHKNNMAGGFFRSTDGGVTWKESKDLSSEAIHAMTQSKDDPNILYVGAATGVWMSKNSGEDWQRIESTSMPRNVNSMAVDPRNTSTIYAGTVWRPYKSTDSGKSWRLIKDGMIDDSDVFAMTVDPRNADHIIASACSGIYESFSGGSKWAKIQGIPSQSRRTRDIVQHPSVAGTIYAGTTEGFWMSTNGGKSWAMTTPRTLEINSIAVHPEAPNRVFIGTNNYGVMVSNDGGRNFTPTNDNFTSRFTYSITPDLTQPNRLYATTQNTATSGGFFFTSNDGGRTWVQAKSLDVVRTSPFSVLQDRTDPNKIYLGTNVGIYISTDRGVTWTLIAPPKSKKPARKVPAKKGAATAKKAAPAPAPAVTAAGPTVVPVLTEKVRVLAFTEDGKNGILAGTDSGLYRTYDIAKGWEKLPFGDGISPSVFVIHASSLIPGTIYVGTATSGVLVSNDDGKTWAKTNGAPDGIPVSSIAVDAKRPNYIYVGTIQSLYLSRDGGRTWQRRGGNLPLGNYTSILIDPKNNDQIFVSSALESDGGIFYSDDAGARWKKVNTKKMRLPSHRVWSMAFDPNDPDRIFAGSHSSGVYRIERQHQADAAGTKRREDTQAAN